MAGQIRIEGGSLSIIDGSLRDSDIAATTKLDADKLQHVYRAGTNFALPIGGTVANREEVVFVAKESGVIRGFHAKLNGAATTGTTSFDLKKNGATVLSAAVAIGAAQGTTEQNGTVSSNTFVAGDVFSIQLSNSAGDGTGPYAYAVLEEDGAAD